MTTARLFVDTKLKAGQALSLSGEQANYLGRVLRCRAGNSLQLFDGSGAEFVATIEAVSRRGIDVSVGESHTPRVESPLGFRLIQGVSRGDRMDTVVQKATELGVHRITPLLSAFSVVKLDAGRAQKRRQHWQRVAASACEQCGRTRIPQIDAICGMDGLFAERAPSAELRIVLHPGARASLAALAEPRSAVDLLIGPEGGFNEAEVERATSAGFVAVSLGPRILRTETAAIAALSLAQALWGDMGAA